MHTAQIWKSIEALNDEAEAALKNSSPVIAVIKSVPPPAPLAEEQIRVAELTVLKSNPPPPTANLVNNHRNDNTSIEPPLSSSSMDEIATAIDRASKGLKTTLIGQNTSQISDDFREDLLSEVAKAVRTVLAAELPQLVRYAVSVSIHELLTTPKIPKAQKTKVDSVEPTDKAKPKKIVAKVAKKPLQPKGLNK